MPNPTPTSELSEHNAIARRYAIKQDIKDAVFGSPPPTIEELADRIGDDHPETVRQCANELVADGELSRLWHRGPHPTRYRDRHAGCETVGELDENRQLWRKRSSGDVVVHLTPDCHHLSAADNSKETTAAKEFDDSAVCSFCRGVTDYNGVESLVDDDGVESQRGVVADD